MPLTEKEAGYYSMRDKTALCGLCPNSCAISKGKNGVCGVRLNEDGISLKLPFYGALSAMALDPIEKKPLYHFYPGSLIFSVGFVGCSLRCPFCQNYSISQSLKVAGKSLPPKDLVELALNEKAESIAYTYSEPLVHAEYVIETSRLARLKGLKNVLVTNGYINPGPGKDVLTHLDAVNIDLKSFSDDFYRKELGGRLQPVLDFIALAAGLVHVEITTLVIPSKNDSEDEIRNIADFIASINRRIPLHLSCYYPTYKYTVPATTPQEVFRLTDTARERLNYVYAGNVGLQETNTLCPSCGALLIRRTGYRVAVTGLERGVCKNCGEKIPIIGT